MNTSQTQYSPSITDSSQLPGLVTDSIKKVGSGVKKSMFWAGEKLAWYLGITKSRYQFELDMNQLEESVLRNRKRHEANVKLEKQTQQIFKDPNCQL
eukprot:TRINITY_DN2370_c0_g2_i1.p1 TRINITY_DN2370_c0_g2~~TRINITY_DN2370_c0_g2_i1.p1  ORF type:complete len:97 (-),score=21.12 TRINITY_DN2370_c0_g2_i1:55-345(-)